MRVQVAPNSDIASQMTPGRTAEEQAGALPLGDRSDGRAGEKVLLVARRPR